MYNKVSVIGDKDSVTALKVVGAEIFNADTAEEARELVKRLTREKFAVVFITEQLAVQIADTLQKAKSQPFPAIVPIPVSSNSNGFGMDGIKKDVEKALGTDILFNKEDK